MKWILVCLLVLFLLLGGLFYSNPILLKTVTGTARILSNNLNATIKIDGEIRPYVKCFVVDSSFNGTPADYLILWIPEDSANYGRDVIFVDRLHHDAGLPNAGDKDYYLMWNRFLLQSESGSKYVPFSSGKFDNQITHFESSDGRISFVVPASSTLPKKKIEITWN